MSSKPRRALLDTSVLIDPPSAQQVDQHADELAVSVIAIGELQYGITAAPDPLEQTRRRQRVQNVLDQFDVLPADCRVLRHHGHAREAAWAQPPSAPHGSADRRDRSASWTPLVDA